MTYLKNKFFLALILLVFLLGVFLRLYNLQNIPLGFHIDEASLGYNGYSLLLTGKDENNHTLPLYIDMFGDNRPSGYHYLTILPIKLLGLNEFATRLPGALFGSITIFAIFFLSQVLFKSFKISILAALFVAIAPWQVVLSRASAETIVAIFLIITGMGFYFWGFEKKRTLYFVLSFLFLGSSFFFYHTPRVFVPLLLLVITLYLYPVWKSFVKKNKLQTLFVLVSISLLAFALVFLIKGGTGRFSQVNIFNSPTTGLVLNEQIREDGVMDFPPILTRFFHNKVINYSLAMVSNYFDYFSGKFLFLEGGLPNWYKVPSMGLIYIVELPFILLGTFYLLKSKDKISRIPLIWLFVAPITASVTVDDIPNIQRAIVMFPAIELIAAFGVVGFFEMLRGNKLKIGIGIFSIFLLFNSLYFLQQYFIQSQVHRNWYRYEGFDRMMQAVNENYNNYNKIVITKSFGGIYPLVLFYSKYNPSTYHIEGSPKDKPDGGFGKFFFVSSECPSFNLDPKVPKIDKIIFIDNGTCKDYKGLNKLKHEYISRKDGTRAFRMIYE